VTGHGTEGPENGTRGNLQSVGRARTPVSVVAKLK